MMCVHNVRIVSTRWCQHYHCGSSMGLAAPPLPPPATAVVASRGAKSQSKKRRPLADPPIHKTLKSIEEAAAAAQRGAPMTYVSRTA